MSPSSGAPRGKIIVHVFGRTDVGRTREHNEDAFVVADLTADDASDATPGTHAHHGRALRSPNHGSPMAWGAPPLEKSPAPWPPTSCFASCRIPQRTNPSASADSFATAIKHAATAANREINAYAATQPEYRGMGTTATIVGLLNDTLYLAQVGDSRAYLVRDGVARQLTKDQSLMQKLVEAGELTEEEAEHSERRNIILQALGPEATIKVDLTYQQVRTGDTLIICSDGLSGQVSTTTLGAWPRRRRS